MLKAKQEEKKQVDKLTLMLSVIAVCVIAVVGAFLLKMQEADHSVIMQPENDVSFETQQASETESALSQLININTASKEELMLLNGIGETKAESIIEYREKIPFETINDIINVNGIGEKIFKDIADKICVE